MPGAGLGRASVNVEALWLWELPWFQKGWSQRNWHRAVAVLEQDRAEGRVVGAPGQPSAFLHLSKPRRLPGCCWLPHWVPWLYRSPTDWHQSPLCSHSRLQCSHAAFQDTEANKRQDSKKTFLVLSFSV